MTLHYRVLLVVAFFLLHGAVFSQIDDFCREHGSFPSLEAPKLNSPYVFGKILLKGTDPAGRPPKVTIIYSDSGQPSVRQTVNSGGNYCFKRLGGDGILLVEVGGTEYVRKTISGFGQPQQREDFEISIALTAQLPAPGVISARFPYERTEKNAALMVKSADAEKRNDKASAISILREAVTSDPNDFIAWTKLGSLYFDENSLVDAEVAFKKALGLKVEYTPAWIYMGRIRAAQKQHDIAIEIFKQAIETDRSSARAHQLLGESYLQVKKGTLGAEALNRAIELDPDGMAESHLLLGKLYDLAGAKSHASKEYKLFLAKRRDHPERSKLEKYIQQNPE